MRMALEEYVLVERNEVRGYAASREFLATFGKLRVIFTSRLTPWQVT